MSSTSRGPTGRSLSSSEFRDVIGRFASGVTVVTTSDDGRRKGTTASAVSSLSLEPPMVLLCLNQSSGTGQAIARTRSFALNILGEDQGSLAMHFASSDPDKFSDEIPVVTGSGGDPLLQDALAALECRVIDTVIGGTHVVFLAEVHDATARDGAPLAYFRGNFGKLDLRDEHGAYSALRGRILDGRIAPGSSLNLTELVSELRLPMGAAQMAVGMLLSDGLLRPGPDGAPQVPSPDLREVDQGLLSRCTIELGVLEVTVGKIGSDEVGLLRESAERSRAAQEPGSPSWRDRHEGSMTFHETLVSLAGCPPLVEAYRQLSVSSLLARSFQGYALGRKDEVYVDEHQLLVDAYEAADLPWAREIVRNHTERIRAEVRSNLGGAPTVA